MTTTYFFDILMPANPIFKKFEPGLHLCVSTKQPFLAALGIGNTVAYRGVAPPQSLTMLLIFLCSELLQNTRVLCTLGSATLITERVGH